MSNTACSSVAYCQSDSYASSSRIWWWFVQSDVCIPVLDSPQIHCPNCLLIPGLSGDSPHDCSQEGKCGDCQEADQARSQCQPYQQSKLCIKEDCKLPTTCMSTLLMRLMFSRVLELWLSPDIFPSAI